MSDLKAHFPARPERQRRQSGTTPGAHVPTGGAGNFSPSAADPRECPKPWRITSRRSGLASASPRVGWVAGPGYFKG